MPYEPVGELPATRWHKIEVRIGDVIITTEQRVTVESAIVTWQEILDAVEVVEDEEITTPPWKQWYGNEHTVTSRDAFPATAEVDRMPGGFFDPHTREYQVVRVAPDPYGAMAVYRASGMSKQAAYERAALDRREQVDRITAWRMGNWAWFSTRIDFKGIKDGCGGYLGADDAATYGAEQLAYATAAALEERGCVVTGKPDPKQERRKEKQRVWKHNLQRDCWIED